MSIPRFGKDDSRARLLAAARSGSTDALGDLLESYRVYLTALAERHIPPDLQSKASADDLVQNALLEALQQFARFSGTSPSALRAWLRTLLLHDLKDFCRGYRTRHKRQNDRESSLDCLIDSKHPADCPLSAFDEKCVQEEISKLVSRLLTTLTATEREIVHMHWLDGLPFKQVGARFDMSANAAQKRCLRALATLADLPYSGDGCEEDSDNAD